MNKLTPFLITVVACFTSVAYSAEESTPPPAEESVGSSKTFSEPFTGRITKNRVRLRLLPSLDGNIISELNQGTLLLVVGETEDFYAVEPPSGTKAYIFRTYVLDNVVEGSRVNVRLRPDMEAPIITQVTSGDRVEGSIDPSNSKWMEIAVPKSAKFYVAKDYLEQAGDGSYIAQYVQRQQEVNLLLNESQRMSQAEMNKPFEEIHVEGVVSKYKRVINNYSDFPDQVTRAKEALNTLQTTYNEKKLAFLENNQNSSSELKAKNEKLAADLQKQQTQVNQLKQKLQKTNAVAANTTPQQQSSSENKGVTYKMSQWVPIEQTIYTGWAQEHDNESSAAFYDEQVKNALVIKGMLETYNRPVKNKPGDYMLINTQNHVPIAFLYSAHVNLQDLIGQEVTLVVSQRPNNNFAFPAYYVLKTQ